MKNIQALIIEARAGRVSVVYMSRGALGLTRMKDNSKIIVGANSDDMA